MLYVLVMFPSQTVLDVARWNTNELSLRPLILKHNFISNGCPIVHLFGLLMKGTDVNKSSVNIAIQYLVLILR